MFHVDLPWTWFIAQGAYSSDNNCQSQKRQRISLNVSHDPRVSWPPWRDVTPLSGTETLPSCERQVVMRASVLYQTHHLSCVINRDMFFLASTIPLYLQHSCLLSKDTTENVSRVRGRTEALWLKAHLMKRDSRTRTRNERGSEILRPNDNRKFMLQHQQYQPEDEKEYL